MNTPSASIQPVFCSDEEHRIRLDVSSSDFPNFDRNHNTGADFWSDTELRVAHQTVFHNAEYPSRLILPVIPRS